MIFSFVIVKIALQVEAISSNYKIDSSHKILFCEQIGLPLTPLSPLQIHPEPNVLWGDLVIPDIFPDCVFPPRGY